MSCCLRVGGEGRGNGNEFENNASDHKLLKLLMMKIWISKRSDQPAMNEKNC